MRSLNWGVCCWVMFLCLSYSARAQDPVYFADANLKAAVESKLNISNPTPSDMLSLIELDADHKFILDLTGLEYATNLTRLSAYSNYITDISPLSGLTKITYLDLFGTDFTDLSPVAGMTSLKYINIEGSDVSDISPLAGITSLERLYADGNRIEDISALAGLSQLRELEIDQNKIQDVSALAKLNTITWLDIDRNDIYDISPLVHLTNLTRLDLTYNSLNQDACAIYIPIIIENNPGIDIEYDTCSGVNEYTLTITSTQGGSVTEPGEGRQGPYTSSTFILLEATPDSGFSFSGWTGSAVDAGKVVSPQSTNTAVVVDRSLTVTANFVAQEQLTLFYVDDNAPTDPWPGDPAGSDAFENGSVSHPFDSIQEAIDLAVDGFVIQVHPGTYYENIDLQGKAIEVMGMDPNDPNTGELPVLYGLGDGPTVRLTETFSGLGSVLKGLAIVGAKGAQFGAVECISSSPTMINCLVTGNHTTQMTGGAVTAVDCNLMLMNCTVAHNSSGALGAGIMLENSQMLLLDSIVWGNTPRGIRGDVDSLVVSQFCDVQEPGLGEGNMTADPLFAARGNWVHPSVPILILTGDHQSSVWLPGDYHLKSQQGRWESQAQAFVKDDVASPCIDAGSDLTFVGQETNPNGNRLNQGVYGGTVFASQTYVESLGFHIPDPKLKLAIMGTLGLWSDPDEQDMLSLYKLKNNVNVNTTWAGIKDLTGLEYAHNLQYANLRANLITDASPLANLMHLQNLNLSENQLTSIAPLSGLTSLKVLDVHGNGLSDMSPIANLTQLEELTSRDNKLSDNLKFLNNLINLTQLDLEENQISDLGAMKNLTQLRDLDVSDNQIYSISALAGMPELRAVDLSRNRISDISPLTGLTHLTMVNLENNRLGTQAYDSDLQTILDNNPGVDLRYDPKP